MLETIGIPPEAAQHADDVWDYVASGLEHGSMDTLDSQKQAVAQGDAQLWAVFKNLTLSGGFTTEVLDRPKGRVCVIIAAAGEAITADGCEKVLKQITPWARSLGCEYIEINGRKGWGRHLKGWTVAHVTHRRVIE